MELAELPDPATGVIVGLAEPDGRLAGRGTESSPADVPVHVRVFPWPAWFLIQIIVLVALPAWADRTTALVDARRSGWDPNEAEITRSLLVAGHFGRVSATPIGGKAYAEPLVFRSNVIVATDANEVIAIDAASGAVRWRTTLGKPTASDCYAASPLLGVHSTPVIDPRSGILYVVARTLGRRGPAYFLSALDATDGRRLKGWPVEIEGHAMNDSTVPFDPAKHLQRAALLLLDGWVYAGFGGFCGAYPFRGWVAGISVATKEVKLWTPAAGVSERSPQAGIWGAGGLVSDGPGTLLLATGDGVLPSPGDRRRNALGNSVVRLRVERDGSLVAVDHFTPARAGYLNDKDLDLGAAAPAVLPDNILVGDRRRLLVQAGREGILYLLDRDDLGGMGEGLGGADRVLGVAGSFGQVDSHPVSWPGDGGYVYVASADGTGPGILRAFRLGTDASRALRLYVAGAASPRMGYGTGSPIITSAGRADGSAILWLIRHAGRASELQAYSAVPTAEGLLELLWSAPVGQATKFSVPASDSGRVHVATGDGHLLTFGDQRLHARDVSASSTRPPLVRRWLVVIVATASAVILLILWLRRDVRTSSAS